MARKHDETYQLIFSQRGAVEDLVRSFVGGDLAEELHFGTLEALPTHRISDDLVRRQVGILWKIRFRGNWLYLLILLEFQSEVDHFMALRILTYTCLTYEELVRRNELGADDKLPPLLPITVYNGPGRRRAARDISQLIAPVPPPLRRHLPRAEREPSAENLRRLMRDMAGRFPAPVFAELRKALLTWVAGAAETWQISRDALARIRTLTEDETMYERVREMREQVHRDGVRKGLEQCLERGLERGRAEGRRALVGRLATRKLGARTAKRLSRVLEDTADPERLAEVFDAVIDCDSDTELFARVGM